MQKKEKLVLNFPPKTSAIEHHSSQMPSEISPTKIDSVNVIKKYLDSQHKIVNEIKTLNNMLDDEFITFKQTEVLEEKIKELQSNLDNLNEEEPNNFNNDLFLELNKFKLQVEDLENMEVEFIFFPIIIKRDVTMIAAPPGSGKTLTSVAMGNMALLDKSIKALIYFDFDNSITTLKERGIEKLIEKWGDKFQYMSPHRKKNNKIVTQKDIWKLIKKLKNSDLTDILIIFDSAKNFLPEGKDRDKNKDVTPLLNTFKNLRNRGGSIVFLHHTNKPSRDDAELQYAGSSAWAEDIANGFILNQNKHKKSFIFSPIKQRTGNIEKMAYIYHKDGHRLEEIDILNAKETKEDVELRNLIIKFLSSRETIQETTYTLIMKHLKDTHKINKDKANKAIQRGKGRYWLSTKIKEMNNKDIYTLISTDKSDKSDKSKEEACI